MPVVPQPSQARSARSSVARNGLMALDDMAYGVGANLLDKACAGAYTRRNAGLRKPCTPPSG